LLKHLGVKDVEQASDGPSQRILEMLSYAQSAEESSIVEATERIRRLAEIFDGIAAARELAKHAVSASESVQNLADAMASRSSASAVKPEEALVVVGISIPPLRRFTVARSQI
jgi:hypothetical protein